MGALGAPELLILGLFFVLPIFVLYKVAMARGQSGMYALWGLLGLIGMVVGLLILIAMPQKATKPTQSRPGGPPPDVF